jgi:hypothetical protein
MSSRQVSTQIVRNTLDRMKMIRATEGQQFKEAVELPEQQNTDIRTVFGLK